LSGSVDARTGASGPTPSSQARRSRGPASVVFRATKGTPARANLLKVAPSVSASGTPSASAGAQRWLSSCDEQSSSAIASSSVTQARGAFSFRPFFLSLGQGGQLLGSLGAAATGSGQAAQASQAADRRPTSKATPQQATRAAAKSASDGGRRWAARSTASSSAAFASCFFLPMGQPGSFYGPLIMRGQTPS
jgi:hypothetical protein